MVLALGADPSKEHESRTDSTSCCPRSIQTGAGRPRRGEGCRPAEGDTRALQLGRGLNGGAAGGAGRPADGVHAAHLDRRCGGSDGRREPFRQAPVHGLSQQRNAHMDFLDMSLTAERGRGYRYYTGSPLFPLGPGSPTARGHSASEETFGAYCPAAARQAVHCARQEHWAAAGSEVVQLYMSPPASLKGVWKAPLPARRLIDFARCALCSCLPVSSLMIGFLVQVASARALRFLHGARRAATADGCRRGPQAGAGGLSPHVHRRRGPGAARRLNLS